MALSVGIVGLPNVGKSTLFNALTNAKADAQNYPFCTIDANEGVVPLVDNRVDRLYELFNSKKKTYTTVTFTDIAGLVKGAAKGEGLGNKFLSHIKEVDAVVQVVRVFEDSEVTHVSNTIDPLRDIDVINTELILKDLDAIDKRLERNERTLKAGKQKDIVKENEVLAKCQAHLNDGKMLYALPLTDEEREVIRPLFFLTVKPTLLAANLAEEELSSPEANEHYKILCAHAAENNLEVVPFSAKIESELAELEAQERVEFLAELGVTCSGVERLAEAGYRMLNLITYLTAGESESRAWTIKEGTKAPQAAGVIHSDFERGFISAEVVPYETLMAAGSFAKAKETGAVRLEGKEYIVEDGDVIIFRFNV